MFQPQSYSAAPSTVGSAWDTLQSTVVPVENHIKGATGRLVYGTNVTIFNKNDVTLTHPSLTFAKPTDATDTVLTGSCWFLVGGVPPHKPHFDLEFTMFRPTGNALSMAVTVDVIGQDHNLTHFTGTLSIPAGSQILQMATVEWLDASALPWFPEFTTNTVAETQAVRLTLATDHTIDEIVSFLSMRFTFYADL